MPSNDQNKPELSYARHPARMSADGWIVVEWRTHGETIDWFPYRCCECLSPDHLRVLHPDLRKRDVRLKIPICRECLGRWQRRRRKVILWGLGLMAITAILA
jgi:hypothetical protein